MLRWVKFFFIFFLILVLKADAQKMQYVHQSNAFLKPKLFINNKFSPPPYNLQSIFSENQNPITKHNNEVCVVGSAVHYDAFFCKLENRIHQRYNIWIKLRTGDFDSYDIRH